MSVIVDACIWSAFFRQSADSALQPIRTELKNLLYRREIVLLGPIRQEVLSGFRLLETFHRVRDYLHDFEDFQPAKEDFETGAEFFNTLRAKGLQGSNTDFLLCAVSHRNGIPIFTTDKDFALFSKHIRIHLHPIPAPQHPHPHS